MKKKMILLFHKISIAEQINEQLYLSIIQLMNH